MATLSLTVVPGKALKDGRHKVRISVAHNSQTRYILTDVILNSTREWKNGKVVKRPDASSSVMVRCNAIKSVLLRQCVAASALPSRGFFVFALHPDNSGSIVYCSAV